MCFVQKLLNTKIMIFVGILGFGRINSTGSWCTTGRRVFLPHVSGSRNFSRREVCSQALLPVVFLDFTFHWFHINIDVLANATTTTLMPVSFPPLTSPSMSLTNINEGPLRSSRSSLRNRAWRMMIFDSAVLLLTFTCCLWNWQNATCFAQYCYYTRSHQSHGHLLHCTVAGSADIAKNARYNVQSLLFPADAMYAVAAVTLKDALLGKYIHLVVYLLEHRQEWYSSRSSMQCYLFTKAPLDRTREFKKFNLHLKNETQLKSF